MPGGEITHSTYASVTANESLGDESSEHLFQISGDYLNAGVNVIAASVHQVNKSSSDLGFQLTLTGSNQTPISLISDSLIKDKTGQLMERSVNLFPLGERNAKDNLDEISERTFFLQFGGPKTLEHNKSLLASDFEIVLVYLFLIKQSCFQD